MAGVGGGGGDGGGGGVEWDYWDWGNTAWKDKFRQLLITGFESDLTIVLGPNKDKKVCVHKIFLQCGSIVLHSKIRKMSGGSNRLELEDIEDYASFVKMIKFFYTGTSGATINEALPLLKMATDFEVMELRDECATLLKGRLTTRDNVLPLFEDAMKFAHKDLILATLRFIGFNARNILKNPGFSKLRLECLIEIIQQDDLRVKDEMEVFDAVYEWGKTECERQGLDPASNEDIRKIIDKPLKYVRFPLMDKEEFAMNVATKDLLSTDEAMKLLMCFLVSPENRIRLPQGRFISAPRNFFTPIVGWEICRGEPDINLEYEGALALHETLCFYVEGCHSLKLQKVVIPKAIYPEDKNVGKTWVEDCGNNHQWSTTTTPLQVEVSLYEGDEVKFVTRSNKILRSNSPGGYCVPFVTTLLNPDTGYAMVAKFSGSSFCHGSKNYTSCSFSPLKCSRDLKNVSNLDANSPATILDNTGKPLSSPQFQIRFEREDPNDEDELPITKGFIERLVFNIEE